MKHILRTTLALALIVTMVAIYLPYTGKTASATTSYTPSYQTLKIGVKSSLRGNAVSTATLSNASGFELGYYNSDRSFHSMGSSSETTIYLSVSGGTVNAKDKNGTLIGYGGNLAVVPQSASSSGTSLSAGDTTVSYLGGFEFVGSGSTITVINYVNIEDYVKGVVPYEMPASWPLESLKAQAICARTYAAANIDKYQDSGFDMCNTTYCQVYGGVYSNETYKAKVNSAVDSTSGEYLLYDGNLISAYFHASSGGATESTENVWMAVLGYCRGVMDPYESTPSTYQTSHTYTAAEFYAKLKAKNPSIGISNIKSISCTYTNTGNILSVTFTDSNGQTATYSKESARIYVLGAFTSYTSQRFKISSSQTSAVTSTVATLPEAAALFFDSSDTADTVDSSAAGVDRLTTVELGEIANEDTGDQTDETAAASDAADDESGTYTPLSASFTITSQGYGHNIGMSQYGARGMAEAGKKYTEILAHYYTGITISNYPYPFLDVSKGDWYSNVVSYVYNNGIFAGTGSTSFSPNDTMTRGDFVTILGKMAGVNTADYQGNGGFSDVSASSYYAPYTQWAVQCGLVAGYGNGKFGPEDAITREDICVILQRYGEYMGVRFPQTRAPVSFSDMSSISDYAKDAVSELQQAGVISGYDDSTFRAKNNTARCEVAAMVSIYDAL